MMSVSIGGAIVSTTLRASPLASAQTINQRNATMAKKTIARRERNEVSVA